VCTLHITRAIDAQLSTLDDAVRAAFEQDPCGHALGRGNCSRPNACTCACRARAPRDAQGRLTVGPWVDALARFRPLPPRVVYGSDACLDGFEGARNGDGTWSSCHLVIKVPSFWERYTLEILGVALGAALLAVTAYAMLRRALRARAIRVRAAKRKARRSAGDGSDSDATRTDASDGGGAAAAAAGAKPAGGVAAFFARRGRSPAPSAPPADGGPPPRIKAPHGGGGASSGGMRKRGPGGAFENM
jgi:hypothetical protein